MSIYLLSPQAKKETKHLPMIEFLLRDTYVELAKCDILMFTSKQAVESIEALNPSWKNIPCLAIGEATAKSIESFGGMVIHQSKTFYAKTLSEDIIKMFKGKTILYLRPKVVSFDAKTFLAKSGIKIQEKIIYETLCIGYDKKSRPEKNAIIIFTSPSTIHCFLENFEWDDSYIAVIIGNATKKHLPVNAKYEVADMPLIDACIVKARQILLSSNSK